MTFLAQSLADGLIADTQAAIYTVPALTRVIVRSIDIGNPGASPVRVKLYVTRNGSVARFVGAADIESEGVLEFLSHGKVLVLSAGDAIEAIANADQEATYVVTGATET